MPGVMTFNADQVRALLELSQQSENRRPTYGQLVAEPSLWRDDMDPSRKMLLEQEIREEGIAMSATQDDIDLTKIPAGLWLVGDQGIYLMSNAVMDERGVSHIAYAGECDPKTMDFDDWYDAKRQIFGGDDGVEFLEAESLEKALAAGGPLKINLTEDAIEILAPDPEGPYLF